MNKPDILTFTTDEQGNDAIVTVTIGREARDGLNEWLNDLFNGDAPEDENGKCYFGIDEDGRWSMSE